MTRERPDDAETKIKTRTKLERHRDARRYKGMKRARVLVPDASTSGLKRVWIWVPNPTARGFREEAERQAKLINGTPEDIEALAFIEAAIELPDE